MLWGIKTFEVLEGRPLHLNSLDRKPFRRVLNLHARLCREKAIEHGWLEDGWDFEDWKTAIHYLAARPIWSRDKEQETPTGYSTMFGIYMLAD